VTEKRDLINDRGELCKTSKNVGLLFVTCLYVLFPRNRIHNVGRYIYSVSVGCRNAGVANGHYRRTQQLGIPDITLGLHFRTHIILV